MTTTAPDAKQVNASWFSRSIRWVLVPFRFLLLSLLVTWTVLAVHYSNLPWTWLRLVLAAPCWRDIASVILSRASAHRCCPCTP